MSAFRPARLGPADLTALVTDPDLAAASGALQAAFTAAVAPKASQASVDALGSTLTPVINTRASQASVDNLGATLGPAIVNATADKSTSAQVVAAQTAILAGQATRATALLDAIAGVAAGTAFFGEIRLFKHAGALTGWTQLSGVFGPTNLYYRARVMLANFDYSSGAGPLTYLTLYAAAVTPGGNVLLLSQFGYLREFNATTEAQAARATCTSPSYQFTQAVTCGAYVYYVSPLNSATSLCYRYDPVADSWSSRASLPGTRVQAGAAYDTTTARLYVFGGYSSNSTLTDANTRSDFAVYDPVANSWVTKTGMPYRLVYPRATSLGGGKILVLAPKLVDVTTGVLVAGSQRAWVYDAVADVWSETDSVPTDTTVVTTPVSICVPLATGRVAFMPSAPSASGARGYIYTHTSAAGARWTPLSMAVTSGAAAGDGTQLNVNGGLGSCVLPSGLVLTTIRQGAGVETLVFISLNIDGAVPTVDQNYYMKN